MAATKKTTTGKPKVKRHKVTEPDGSRHRVFAMPFAKIYPAWLTKVERKQRSREELHQVFRWLTGYTDADLQKWITGDENLGAFLDQAPAFNPAAELITGTICGIRVETIEEPYMRKLRQLDKLIDELAKGKAMEKILRSAP